jgi:hypothetical protein
MKSRTLGAIGVVVFAAIPVAAYDHPLGSHAIREAYFIGAGNYVEGLAGYTKSLPVPKTGPHVAEMEVRTPFAQVVLMSSEHSVGYSAQQAAQDYRKNPDILHVRVEILSTATFSFISPLPMLPTLAGGTSPGLGDARWPELRQGACGGIFLRVLPVKQCFRDFRFQFSQAKEIKPKSSYGLSINSGYDTIGGDVWFLFSTNDIASAPFRVTVYTPDGQEVSAEFDLAALR